MQIKERYNLMLSPGVIEKIDIIARNLGVTRSVLVNKILSDFIIIESEVVINDS